MKIEFGDRVWQVDVDELSLQQALVITGRMGTALTGWEKALSDPENPDWEKSLQCLYWLMLQQDGQKVPIGDVDFAVLKYSRAVAAAIEQEEAASAGQEKDPTPPPGEPGSDGTPAS